MAYRAAFNGVGALIDRVGRVTRGLQFADGLSPAQWEALRYVSLANRYSRNPSALAAYLGATKGTVSQTLIALEAKGYLRRVRASTDRRAVRLELTPAGEELLRRDPLALVDDVVLDALPLDETALLTDSLTRLLRALHEHCGANGFGVCEDCVLFDPVDTARDPVGHHRCGLTGEAVDSDERLRICVNFRTGA